MINHQRMTLAAARSSQQHWLVDQSFLVNEVKKVLEQSGVRPPVDWSGHDQHVSPFNRYERPLQSIGQLGPADSTSELRRNLTQFDHVLFALNLVRNQVQKVLCQGCCL